MAKTIDQFVRELEERERIMQEGYYDDLDILYGAQIRDRKIPKSSKKYKPSLEERFYLELNERKNNYSEFFQSKDAYIRINKVSGNMQNFLPVCNVLYFMSVKEYPNEEFLKPYDYINSFIINLHNSKEVSMNIDNFYPYERTTLRNDKILLNFSKEFYSKLNLNYFREKRSKLKNIYIPKFYVMEFIPTFKTSFEDSEDSICLTKILDITLMEYRTNKIDFFEYIRRILVVIKYLVISKKISLDMVDLEILKVLESEDLHFSDWIKEGYFKLKTDNFNKRNNSICCLKYDVSSFIGGFDIFTFNREFILSRGNFPSPIQEVKDMLNNAQKLSITLSFFPEYIKSCPYSEAIEACLYQEFRSINTNEQKLKMIQYDNNGYYDRRNRAELKNMHNFVLWNKLETCKRFDIFLFSYRELKNIQNKHSNLMDIKKIILDKLVEKARQQGLDLNTSESQDYLENYFVQHIRDIIYLSFYALYKQGKFKPYIFTYRKKDYKVYLQPVVYKNVSEVENIDDLYQMDIVSEDNTWRVDRKTLAEYYITSRLSL